MTPMPELNAVAGGWRQEGTATRRKWLAGLSALGLGIGLGYALVYRSRVGNLE